MKSTAQSIAGEVEKKVENERNKEDKNSSPINKKFIFISIGTFFFVTFFAHYLKPDFIESLFVLLGVIAWPVVTVIIFAIFFLTFQKQIGNFIERIQEFEFSSTKVKADPNKIKKVDEIRQKTASNQEAAEQLLESKVLEVSELRILRGLVGESEGRYFYSYRRNDYYRPAFDSLAAKGLILRQENNKYFLQPLGKEVVKLHVAQSLE